MGRIMTRMEEKRIKFGRRYSSGTFRIQGDVELSADAAAQALASLQKRYPALNFTQAQMASANIDVNDLTAEKIAAHLASCTKTGRLQCDKPNESGKPQKEDHVDTDPEVVARSSDEGRNVKAPKSQTLLLDMGYRKLCRFLRPCPLGGCTVAAVDPNTGAVDMSTTWRSQFWQYATKSMHNFDNLQVGMVFENWTGETKGDWAVVEEVEACGVTCRLVATKLPIWFNLKNCNPRDFKTVSPIHLPKALKDNWDRIPETGDVVRFGAMVTDHVITEVSGNLCKVSEHSKYLPLHELKVWRRAGTKKSAVETPKESIRYQCGELHWFKRKDNHGTGFPVRAFNSEDGCIDVTSLGPDGSGDYKDVYSITDMSELQPCAKLLNMSTGEHKRLRVGDVLEVTNTGEPANASWHTVINIMDNAIKTRDRFGEVTTWDVVDDTYCRLAVVEHRCLTAAQIADMAFPAAVGDRVRLDRGDMDWVVTSVDEGGAVIRTLNKTPPSNRAVDLERLTVWERAAKPVVETPKAEEKKPEVVAIPRGAYVRCAKGKIWPNLPGWEPIRIVAGVNESMQTVDLAYLTFVDPENVHGCHGPNMSDWKVAMSDLVVIPVAEVEAAITGHITLIDRKLPAANPTKFGLPNEGKIWPRLNTNVKLFHCGCCLGARFVPNINREPLYVKCPECR